MESSDTDSNSNSSIEHVDQISFDEKECIPFKSNSSILIVAPTNSGKSTLVTDILKYKQQLFDDPPLRIMFCYRYTQSIFEDLTATHAPQIDFHFGLPSEDEIDAFSHPDEHRLIVLDDLATDIINSSVIENLITGACHHKRLTTVITLQNLFPRGKIARTIFLNSTYIILFENFRDKRQIKLFGERLYPQKSDIFLSIFSDAIRRKWGYLLIDLASSTHDNLRLRTDILPIDGYTVIYNI